MVGGGGGTGGVCGGKGSLYPGRAPLDRGYIPSIRVRVRVAVRVRIKDTFLLVLPVVIDGEEPRQLYLHPHPIKGMV